MFKEHISSGKQYKHFENPSLERLPVEIVGGAVERRFVQVDRRFFRPVVAHVQVTHLQMNG